MIKLVPILLFTLLYSPLVAQPQWQIDDSIHIANGYQPVPFEKLQSEKKYCRINETIDSDSLLNILRQRCGYKNDTIDFTTHILLSNYFGGDCHVQFKHYLYLDSTTKTLWWNVYNIYGGCRAGGGSHFLLKTPKPPAGYTIKTNEIRVDRQRKYGLGFE